MIVLRGLRLEYTSGKKLFPTQLHVTVAVSHMDENLARNNTKSHLRKKKYVSKLATNCQTYD